MDLEGRKTQRGSRGLTTGARLPGQSPEAGGRIHAGRSGTGGGLSSKAHRPGWPILRARRESSFSTEPKKRSRREGPSPPRGQGARGELDVAHHRTRAGAKALRAGLGARPGGARARRPWGRGAGEQRAGPRGPEGEERKGGGEAGHSALGGTFPSVPRKPRLCTRLPEMRGAGKAAGSHPCVTCPRSSA